jgi:hypothetical protein
MARQPKKGSGSFAWALPETKKMQDALEYFNARSRLPYKRTLPFVVHNPSPWKARELITGLDYRLCLLERILAEWKEDSEKPRDDGALALVLKMQNDQYKSRTLANEIRKRFPQDPDSRFLSRFYESICRDAAQMIVQWAKSKIKQAVLAHKKIQKNDSTVQTAANEKYIPSLEEIYEFWQRQEAEYQRAASRTINFGRNRGEKLEDRGNREARWLLKYLLPEDEITDFLTEVEELLDNESGLRDITSGLTEHRWQLLEHSDDDVKHRRAVRESRLWQRLVTDGADFGLLGLLDRNELQALRKELREMQSGTQAYKEAILVLQAALSETDATKTEWKDLRHDLEVFLFERPDSYPSVVRGAWSEHHQKDLQESYEVWLNWFSLYKGKRLSAEKYINEREEERSKQGMLKAMSMLRPPRRLVLSLIGTTRPGQYRDFALLYNRTNYHFTLAVMLHKPHAFGENHEVLHRDEQNEQRTKEQQKYAKRREQNPLYYVNFPLTRFDPPKDTSVLFLPLDYGGSYQSDLIRDVIKLQRAEQRKILASAGDATVSAEALPAAICKSAKLLCERDKAGKLHFAAHISFEFPPPDALPCPKRVLGIHERDGRYYYAVLELDGTLCAAAELRIEPHTDPARGATSNTDNYVYALADAMIAKARMWEAYIGIEDTKWKKEDPTLSRTRNRKIFATPTQRVLKALQQRAARVGFMPPRLVTNVSPVRDCADCHMRLAEKQNSPERVAIICCPVCHEWIRCNAEGGNQYCRMCSHTWTPMSASIRRDLLFACESCFALEMPVWRNTAIVVAQRTAVDVARHHANALAAEARRERARITNGMLLEIDVKDQIA